ncbi:MAG TPA: hypothetical protein VF549_15060 [Solirubrobacteraceae bacterium]
MTAELLVAAARADDPPTIVILLLVAAGLGVAILANRIGDRRARRRFDALGVPESSRHAEVSRVRLSARESRARRSIAGYARFIVDAPGFWLRLAAVVALAAANWVRAGAEEALIAVGIGLLFIFPFGYVGWRFWWWRAAGSGSSPAGASPREESVRTSRPLAPLVAGGAARGARGARADATRPRTLAPRPGR